MSITFKENISSPLINKERESNSYFKSSSPFASRKLTSSTDASSVLLQAPKREFNRRKEEEILKNDNFLLDSPAEDGFSIEMEIDLDLNSKEKRGKYKFSENEFEEKGGFSKIIYEKLSNKVKMMNLK